MTIQLSMRTKLAAMLAEKHRFLPLAKGTKKPVFPNWPNSKPDQGTLFAWLDQEFEIGWIQDLTTSLDFDSDETMTGKQRARIFWNTHGPFRCAIQETPRQGIHLSFKSTSSARNAVKVNNLYDIRGGGAGYLKLYGFVDGYSTTDPAKLDEFRDEWLPSAVHKTTPIINHVREYVMTIESFEGNAGNKGLIRAIIKCRDNGLSIAETTLLLSEWNQGPTVNPPWAEKELARAITNMYESQI